MQRKTLLCLGKELGLKWMYRIVWKNRKTNFEGKGRWYDCFKMLNGAVERTKLKEQSQNLDIQYYIEINPS